MSTLSTKPPIGFKLRTSDWRASERLHRMPGSRTRRSSFATLPRAHRYVRKPIELELPRSSCVGVHVDFLIADLKMRSDDSLQLFELGGVGSRLSGYYRLHRGREPERYDLKRAFLKIIRRLGKPMVTFEDFSSYDTKLKRRGALGFLAMPLMGGMIMTQPQFEQRFDVPGSVETLDDIEAVIVNPFIPDYYPHLPVRYVNHYTALLTMSKLSLLRILDDAMPQFCPKTLWVRGSDTPEDIAAQARRMFDSERLVLKPTSLSGGQGVQCIDRGEVSQALSAVLKNSHHSLQSYLLQEYVEGKAVRSPLTGYRYDPTMRFVFGALVEENKALLYPLDAYWKLPLHPLGRDGRGRDISCVRGGEISLPVCEDDYMRMVDAMKIFVKKFYAKRHMCVSRWEQFAEYEMYDIQDKLKRMLLSMTGKTVEL